MRQFVVAVCLLALASCSGWNGNNRFTSTQVLSFPIGSKASLTAKNLTGAIVVHVWNKPQIRATIVKEAPDESSLASITVSTHANGSNVTLETNQPATFSGGVRETIDVPQNTTLDCEQSIGSVEANGLAGSATLAAKTGEVRASFERLSGTQHVKLSTVVGAVRLTVPNNANATFTTSTNIGAVNNAAGAKMGTGSARVSASAGTGSILIAVEKE